MDEDVIEQIREHERAEIRNIQRNIIYPRAVVLPSSNLKRVEMPQEYIPGISVSMIVLPEVSCFEKWFKKCVEKLCNWF